MKKFSILFLILFSLCGNSSAKQEDAAYGINISKHQDKVVNDSNTNSSLSFIVCKATEGQDYVDPNFTSNWKQIKRRGFVRGAYHLYRDSDDPFTQAKLFLKKINDLDHTDLPPIVDIGNSSLTSESEKRLLQKNLLQHLQYIESQSGRKPIIYTNLHFADRYLDSEKFAQYPLWLAEFSGRKKPTLPKTWKKIGYRFWQKSERYTVGSAIKDLDIFNGAKKDLLTCPSQSGN